MITANPHERLIGLLPGTPEEEAAKWFTRPGLAVALQVSVSTIDRMVKSEELPCVRLRGRVRFYLPDVVEALRKGNRKFGRAADLTAESAKIAERGPAGAGNPKPEIRIPKEAA